MDCAEIHMEMSNLAVDSTEGQCGQLSTNLNVGRDEEAMSLEK